MKSAQIGFTIALILFINFLHAQAPSCVMFFNPANGATNQFISTITLKWQPVQLANGYDIYFGTSDPSLATTPYRSTTTDTSILISNLLPNTTYFWQVRSKYFSSIATDCSVQTFTTGSEVANNSCINAEDISDKQPRKGDTRFANQSMALANCEGLISDGGDVWYLFTNSTTETVILTVAPTINTLFDPVVFAYSGTCSNLQTIGCADVTGPGQDEILTLTNLPAGTYFIRVYNFNPGDEGTFSISAGGSALPITLSSFKGERQGSKNILTWTTLSEQNNKGFELQRSADGTHFSLLSFVDSKAANGNSTSSLVYSFDDSDPSIGNSYYRLKQIDKDGRSTLSNVVMIKSDKVSALTITNTYPNPATDIINLAIAAPSNNEISLMITDIAGRVVLHQSISLVSGDNNLSVNVSKLTSGNYLIKAIYSTGGESRVARFVKK